MVSIDAFLDVPGHLYPEEGRVLQGLARGLRVLEIGTFRGRSTIAMAATAKSVVTIDNYQGSEGYLDAPDINQTRTHLANADAVNVTALVGNWEDIVGRKLLEDFDMVFYDANHYSELGACEREFLAICRDFPGIVAVHDYKPWDPTMRDVVAAVDEFVRETGRIRLGPEPRRTSIVWFPVV